MPEAAWVVAVPGELVIVNKSNLVVICMVTLTKHPFCDKGINDEHQDVHDKALLYYRLLRHNVQDAEKIISATLPTVSGFSEELTAEMKDKIFSEFNSLSIIYQVSSPSLHSNWYFPESSCLF